MVHDEIMSKDKMSEAILCEKHSHNFLRAKKETKGKVSFIETVNQGNWCLSIKLRL